MGWAKEGRSYPTEQGGVWSSTTILGIKDKSGALTQWAANECAKYIDEAVCSTATREEGRADYIRLPLSTFKMIVESGKKAFRSKKDEAADIGTTVHRLIEGWFKVGRHPMLPMDSRVVNAFDLFVSWAKEVELEPLIIEQPVHSLRHEYGGTFDILARGKFDKKWRKKRTYLIDTKTSKAIYDTFPAQVASYSEAYREMAAAKRLPAHKVDGEGIIRVGKTDVEFEFVDCTEHHDLNFLRFLSLKDAYILWNGRPK